MRAFFLGFADGGELEGDEPAFGWVAGDYAMCCTVSDPDIELGAGEVFG